MRLRWLGTDRLTWSDLLAVVRQSGRGTALFRAMAGEDGEWDLNAHISAGIFDLLALANWQRGGDQAAKKPEQLKRPGVEKRVDGQMLAQGKAVPIEDMNALLGW